MNKNEVMKGLQGKEELARYKELFRGRGDVFARHWQKGKKQGYMPAYQFDPYMYQLHKRNGGSFKTYKDKNFLPLSDDQLLKHFQGDTLIGIYPLLHDNTSWFMVADFDKENWIKESKTFLEFCRKNGVPAYLERSRSGNGGHVWIFFDQPFPAVKSRKIFTNFLEQLGCISVFDKSSSFDRLFPNQDFLSGKGLGNLIALPLHGSALENGNSCFVDDDLNPFQDQWGFLQNVKKASISGLDEIFSNLNMDSKSIHVEEPLKDGKLPVVLDNRIHLDTRLMPPPLISFLKNELIFPNPEFFIKKKSGRNTWGTERYFNFIEETGNEIIIPRGFIGRILRFCKKEKIDIKFIDKRKRPKEVKFTPKMELRPYQNKVLEITVIKDYGVITAPPGSGKTIIGLQIISEKELPALIVVHRKQLMEQWIERIEGFLGIPRREIGRIGQGKTKIGKAVTVAMIQSLGKQIERSKDPDFNSSFGTLLVDECHHIPAETYHKTISALAPYYQYGLTATPFRKFNDGKMIFIHLGEIIAKVEPQEILGYKIPQIVIRNTLLDVPYDSKTDPFEVLSKMLIHDSARNKLIYEDVVSEVRKGKKVVLLTERKVHIDILYQFFKQSFEVITLSGEDGEKDRNLKWQSLKSREFQVLITTGQYFGEGTDLQNASCLFLVYPFSFKGKLIQYIGRVQRSEKTPVIYDYRDLKIEYLDKLFLRRNVHYRNFDKQATLFDEEEQNVREKDNSQIFEKSVKISFEDLEFRYGAVAFNYKIPQIEKLYEFEIENDHFRTEFDVLKPYFAKVLRTKTVEVHLYAEIVNEKIVAQQAISQNLEKINREIIEGVKFRFLTKGVKGKKFVLEANDELSEADRLKRSDEIRSLYNSEEDLLDGLLQNKKYKHYRELRYLSSVHDNGKFKIRFVLDPFSFVFFISGEEQNYIVLETLDTEEATYIWHLNKKNPEANFESFNKHLSVIKYKGRHAFLENQPENFSRVFHDYSDERKGFIIWKGLLEERLI